MLIRLPLCSDAEATPGSERTFTSTSEAIEMVGKLQVALRLRSVNTELMAASFVVPDEVAKSVPIPLCRSTSQRTDPVCPNLQAERRRSHDHLPWPARHAA